MVATRVTESYASLFLTSEPNDGSRQAAIARIGAFELRLLEMPSVNSPKEASLWVELCDRDHRLSVDSCKCSDLDEAIDATHLLMTQAKRLNYAAGESAPSSFEGLQKIYRYSKTALVGTGEIGGALSGDGTGSVFYISLGPAMSAFCP